MLDLGLTVSLPAVPCSMTGGHGTASFPATRPITFKNQWENFDQHPSKIGNHSYDETVAPSDQLQAF